MAKGGLVSGPVNALVGEGKDNELVTPLNDETFIKFGEGILNANERNYSQFSKQNASWLSQLGDESSLFNFSFGGGGGGDKGLMKELNTTANDIATKVNQLSTDVTTISNVIPNIVNNITNNNVGNNGGNGGGESNGGNFSDSGLDAWRLNYIGSLG